MKHLILTVTALLTFMITSAQIISQSDVQTIKNAKIIVGLTGDTEIDGYFKQAIKDAWTFTEITEYLPIDEALKKAKKSDEYVVFFIQNIKKTSVSKAQELMYITHSNYLTLGKNKMKAYSRKVLPTLLKSDEYNRVAFYFSVSSLNADLISMDRNNYKNSITLSKNYPSELLKEKTLAIPSFWLNEKVTEEVLKEIYPWKYELVGFEKWADIITFKTPGYIYIMIAAVATSKTYVYPHILINAENGETVGLAQKSVKVLIPLSVGVGGALSVSVGNQLLDLGKKYSIDKAMLKKYVKFAD